jgi:hypothetical protein
VTVDGIFDPWCTPFQNRKGRKSICILRERLAHRAKAIQAIARVIPEHYYPPGLLEQRLKKLGYEKTAASIKGHLPQTKRARSGDLGEVLATEFVNRKLEFKVPVFRLRWKDGRDMALRGDDVVAIRIDELHRLHFLKGEVKSRQIISSSTISDAAAQLRRHRGRPSPFVLNFIANRLYEGNETDLYERLEQHLTGRAIPMQRLTHFIFTLSGNDSETLLSGYLQSYSGSIEQLVVGLVVTNHGALVDATFQEVKLA